VDARLAGQLVQIAARSRNLKGHGLEEGASTRMLVHAGQLISRGVPLGEACQVALVLPITDDPDIRDALTSAIAACA
jgi:nitric oxide reductase NorQ protein